MVVGDRPGRESDDEIIYVNTVGLGVQDVALGSLSCQGAGKGPRDHRQDVGRAFCALMCRGCPLHSLSAGYQAHAYRKRCPWRNAVAGRGVLRHSGVPFPLEFRCDGQNLQRLSRRGSRAGGNQEGLRPGEPGHRRARRR
ncbi:MAG: hypothetical protein ACLRWP_09275 [Bilophila wadsworthia]